MKTIKHCQCVERTELEKAYHNTEWGIPIHDDKILFKMLSLECMQASLSWSTVLKKK